MDESAVLFGWKSCRSAMRKAVKDNDVEAIHRTWREFERFCGAHSWPDWWQELERADLDATLGGLDV